MFLDEAILSTKRLLENWPYVNTRADCFKIMFLLDYELEISIA